MSIKLKDTIYDLINNADKLDGSHLTDIIRYYTPSSSNVLNLDDLKSTTGFQVTGWAYAGSPYVNSQPDGDGASSAATVIKFPGNYPFQIYRFYSNNNIKIRGYYSGTGWTSWATILTSDNYTTYCASASHSHNYASTVKIGSTSYTCSSNVISLPAYPTIPTSLKCPKSLTIQLNGTSQGAWDGSADKTINITPASIGASAAHNHPYLPLSGGTLTGNFAANNDTRTPFNLTTNLYYVNKALNWRASSYLRNVILLIPVQTSTNWSGYNYIDGKFLLWKSGGNVYDIVEVNLNNVYNVLEYRLLASGQYSSLYKLCICKYNGVSYYAIDCPYHANPYNNAEFYGHIRSSLTGGTNTVNLPLTVDYYNENTQTVLNSEVKDSITSTLTTSVVTSVNSRNLFSIAGFSGSLSGNASSASKLGTNAGAATNPVYFSGGIPVACTYSLNKTVPSNAVFTDTTYSAGTGISLSGTTFSNSGVRSISTGDNNGTIKVNTGGTSTNVSVKGLGSAAYLDTTGVFTATTHSDYNNNQTQLVSRSFMSYWTGAYNSSGTSNLTYCKHGAFGNACTKAYTTSVTSGSGSLVTSGAVYTALQSYSKTDHTHSYAGKVSIAFTPATGELTAANVLSHTGGFSIAKGTWSYAGNGYIKAGSFGNIDLAGCSVLTFGSGSVFTQLYITASTQSGHSGLTNEMFFYNDHGSNYSPGWTRVLTNRNYGSYCAAKSHTHSYLPLSGGTINNGALNMTNNRLRMVGTSATPAWNQAGAITWCESVNDGQPVSIVYTSYDSYRAPAGLKVMGSQGGEWFEAPKIYCTNLYIGGEQITFTT